ncbi:MAG: C-GCAxxG-C-C family (seleno)protein [Halanaerobiales bacterium]
MLADLLKNGFAEGKDLNCSEQILYGANQAYDLGLDKNALKLAAGFGGGMAIEDKCGALTGSIMVLSNMFIKERAHENDKIKELVSKLFSRYREVMGSIDCRPLKDDHRTEAYGCREVILKAAEILDQIIKEESN